MAQEERRQADAAKENWLHDIVERVARKWLAKARDALAARKAAEWAASKEYAQAKASRRKVKRRAMLVESATARGLLQAPRHRNDERGQCAPLERCAPASGSA